MPRPSNRPPGRSRSVRQTIALPLLGALIFFALGEIAARSLGLVDRLNRYPRHVYQNANQPDLDYQLRPRLDTTIRGKRVVTDERGFRVAEPAARNAPPPPEATRILLLGDSVAFGYHLSYEDSVAARLQDRLERTTGRRHHVWNAGVPGYNTVAELAWLKAHVDTLDPDLIVLLFNLNDHDAAPVLGPNGILTTNRSVRASRWSLAERSDFYVLLRWLARRTASQIGRWVDPPPPMPPAAVNVSGQSFEDFDRFVSELRKRSYLKPKDLGHEAMAEALAELGLVARARRIPLRIAIVPDGDQVGFASPNLAPQARLRALCEELALHCLDLTPAFERRAGDGPLFVDIMHPNARGHDVAAETIASWLVEEPT